MRSTPGERFERTFDEVTPHDLVPTARQRIAALEAAGHPAVKTGWGPTRPALASPIWDDAMSVRRADGRDMAHADGWPALFSGAFRQSRNAMVLVDERRRVLDVNAALVRLVGRGLETVVGRPVWELVADGPLASEREWRDQIATRRFTGEAPLRHADGSAIGVQWGATVEVVAGCRLVLFVALSTSRWGARYRRTADADGPPRALSAREREVVRLVALGATGPEIADELQISHDTVRTHVRNAMNKCGARSRAHLVAKALGEELLVR